MANKEATVAELTELFSSSTAVLLTEYRGLTVAQLKKLRTNIREDASYAVVKNTLTKIAANQAGIDSLDDMLAGPSALAFVHGDPVTVAKALQFSGHAQHAVGQVPVVHVAAPAPRRTISKLAPMAMSTPPNTRFCSRRARAPCIHACRLEASQA